ncbi:MAG: T9SS type A sorting domain-containing protein, partial [Bacteroidales bacterium]|nr:T9SS type A sorting domain-containing protein [Bacteroidales bacterium]
GDGSFDYKNITNPNTNYIPVWESTESLNPVNSYCTDDFYSEFDEEDKTSMLKIGIGRLPVKSTQEANAVVEKIIHYSSNENAFGSWKNNFCLIADDEDNNLHLYNAEDIGEIVDTTDQIFNISKIYLDAYEQVSDTNGESYPDVNQALTDKINTGVSIVNYVGHASYYGIAHEKILTEEDLENWENYNFYPLLFTASCDFGRFDDPDRYSLAEKAFLLENRGLSALISATRATYAGSNHAFQKRFFINTLHHSEYSLGKLLKLSKQEAGGFDNNRKYCLFGDPSMRLVIPEYEVITEAINGVQVTEPLDTIHPGEQLIISGYIVDAEGEQFYNFNGPLEVRIFDRIDTLSTLGNDPQSIVTDFTVKDSVLLTLNTDIMNGQFAFVFNLPNNLDEEFGTLKFSYYGMDFPLDARGQFSDLVVGGQPSAINEMKAMDEILTIYPIPVKSQLNCLAKQNINHLQLDLYDLTGRKIHSHSEQNIPEGKVSSLELSALKPGLYIMWINADNQFSTIKVIKQ